MNVYIAAARVFVGIAAVVLLLCARESLRRGPVPASVRIIAWAAGFYLVLGGILLILGVL